MNMKELLEVGSELGNTISENAATLLGVYGTTTWEEIERELAITESPERRVALLNLQDDIASYNCSGLLCEL